MNAYRKFLRRMWTANELSSKKATHIFPWISVCAAAVWALPDAAHRRTSCPVCPCRICGHQSRAQRMGHVTTSQDTQPPHRCAYSVLRLADVPFLCAGMIFIWITWIYLSTGECEGKNKLNDLIKRDYKYLNLRLKFNLFCI